jgi:tRNA(Ile)-lysidine synthase TilS/MesJ
MLNFNDRIAVAVSGGKDSLSLLHVLAKMERFRPRASLVARQKALIRESSTQVSIMAVGRKEYQST